MNCPSAVNRNCIAAFPSYLHSSDISHSPALVGRLPRNHAYLEGPALPRAEESSPTSTWCHRNLGDTRQGTKSKGTEKA
jgi:hypothetical protein